MKKGQVCLYFFVAALMFVAVFLSGFLSFGAENCFSLPDKAQDETFEGYEGGRYVYVGGAVESSGWFFLRDGATYGELLAAPLPNIYRLIPCPLEAEERSFSTIAKGASFIRP
jgi:hypothetical protein